MKRSKIDGEMLLSNIRIKLECKVSEQEFKFGCNNSSIKT